MNENKKSREAKKAKKQAKQAQKVIRGIFIALILLAIGYVIFVTNMV